MYSYPMPALTAFSTEQSIMLRQKKVGLAASNTPISTNQPESTMPLIVTLVSWNGSTGPSRAWWSRQLFALSLLCSCLRYRLNFVAILSACIITPIAPALHERERERESKGERERERIRNLYLPCPNKPQFISPMKIVHHFRHELVENGVQY